MNNVLVIATRNKGKVIEIKHLLKPLKLHILSLIDFPGIKEIKEDGKTFKDNAMKKAKVIAGKLGMLTVADDSGLEVEALGGRPGIRSARYAGPDPTTKKLCGKLLKEMRDVRCEKERRSRFVCNVAIAWPSGKVKVFEGACRGRIIDKMLGTHGFGYDPVFMPEGYRKTFAQMPMKLKNRISHRGKALARAKRYLMQVFGIKTR